MADQQSIRVLTERLERNRRIAADAIQQREEKISQLEKIVWEIEDLVTGHTCIEDYDCPLCEILKLVAG